jgi:hypothetical protein
VRFAVHRPGIPAASPRSHDEPRHDVDSRIHVSVAGISAGRAREPRLALTRSRIHLPARRAPLARERSTDLLHPDRAAATVTPRSMGWRGTSGTAPTRPCAPGLAHPDLPGPVAEPAHIPLPPVPHDAEPLIAARLAPRRAPGRVARVQERGHCPGEVPQRLPLDGLRAGGQPRVPDAGSGELPALLQVARRALAAAAPLLMLPDARFSRVLACAQWSCSTASWAGVGTSRYLDMRTH